MNPRPEYPKFAHPWIATEDDWGMAEPACACGDRLLPGEECCADCFIAAAHRRADAEVAARFRQAPFSPSWRRFPATPVTPKENEE